MKFIKREWEILKTAAKKWDKDHALRLAAALSYYTVFSLSPLLIVMIAIAGLVFGADAARGELSTQIAGLVGKSGAEAIENLIANNRKESTNVLASVVGVVVLLVGAGGVFVELKSALNKIWSVEKKKVTGIKALIRDRLLSFGMVMSIGFLFLVSLVVNAALSAMGKYMHGLLPASETLLQIAMFLVSFGVITALFALIFKFLPETKVEWKNVWTGAALTSLLFTIGKFVIGMYLGKSSIASSFGASSSVVVVMVWAYYSALILYFGAEYTNVLSTHRNARTKA
jgi:membrane protein